MSIGSISYYETMMMRRQRPQSLSPSPSASTPSISYYEFMMLRRNRLLGPQPIPPPIPTTTLASTIRDVFQAWRQILVDSGYFQPSSNVIISLDEDEFPQSGTAYVLLCPLYFVPDDGSVNGGGRYVTIMDGQFSVIVRTRNRLNLAYQDSYIINNADQTGIFWLTDQVLDALHMTLPLNSNGDLLVAEPIRLNRYEKASRAGTQSEWTGIRVVFDCSLRYYFPTDTGN